MGKFYHSHQTPKVIAKKRSSRYSSPMLFPLEEQIRPRATQIDDLRTPIAILFQAGTLETIKGVANPFPATHDAFILVVAERTFVADTYEGGGPNVGVTDRAFAVAFVA
ncbi:hypothetical protein AJ78_03659 [Emergomyces pasteurianus Ep9510]|uniref:Uncharacterized protein n=1 Tax=Emergomyces pasteurianus Ep9510 TaxID=1447872 RepID=A0A1J9PJU3_9EURO|nr:hypothetical protein AJ78_03659 [Emergomyces pasteurianus Ep9510]